MTHGPVPSRCVQCAARVRHSRCTNPRCRAVYGKASRQKIIKKSKDPTLWSIPRADYDRLRRHEP